MGIQTSELSAVVTQYIEDEKVWDAQSKRTAFLSHLITKGKKQISGGVTYNFPIKLLKNTTSGFISGVNALTSATPSIQLQYGVLQHKYYNFNVNFTLQDFTVANGENEKVDFMAEKTEGALQDAIREISTAVHGTSASNALAPEGLLDVVATTGTAYAGLTDTNYDTGTYLGIYDSTSSTPNYASIESNYIKLQGRMMKELTPDSIMGLMNPATYGKFKVSCQNQMLFSPSDVFKAGAVGFHVDGVNFYLDSDVPGSQDGSTGDNYIYLFPTDVMKLFVRFGFGSKSPFDGEVNMPLQPIASNQHYMAFNLACVNRRLVVAMKTIIA